MLYLIPLTTMWWSEASSLKKLPPKQIGPVRNFPCTSNNFLFHYCGIDIIRQDPEFFWILTGKSLSHGIILVALNKNLDLKVWESVTTVACPTFLRPVLLRTQTVIPEALSETCKRVRCFIYT